MKRNLLLLAVMIMTVSAFSSLYAQCPQAPNDNGACDTLSMEVWSEDLNFPLPTGYAKISLYVSHDQPNPVDSIPAFVIPLCYTHTNPSKFCSVTTYQNQILWGDSQRPRSVFRHLPDNATATVHNWMMDLYDEENGEEWNGIILDLDGVSHFWLTMIRTGVEDKKYGETTKRLTATMSFKLEDSMMICIDSCFWPPTSRLKFARSDAATYIPRMSWKDANGEGTFCHDFFIIPHQPPELTCPGTQSHNANGSFSAEGSAIIHDQAIITSALATFTGSGVTGMSASAGTPVGDTVPIHIDYDVINHCAAGGSVRVIVADSQGAKDTCFFGITLRNSPPSITCPSNGSIHAGDMFISTNFSVADSGGDYAPVTFLGIAPSATNNPSIVFSHVEWNTTCAEKGIYTISLLATDPCGAKDTCQFTVTVYNQPPVLTCPNNGNVRAGDKFTSTNYSVIDPESDSTSVSLLDITPPATNTPTLVDSHVEWLTVCSESGIYTIRLTAADSCDAKDTCSFQITVANTAPEITCPDSMAVHTGHHSSGGFNINGSAGDTIVQVNGWVIPSGSGVANLTVMGGTGATPTSGHVEFDADCSYPGIYIISLEAIDKCGFTDTCAFQVRLYFERPPQLTCPSDDSVHTPHKLISTDFSVTDPDGDIAAVTFMSITPSATNNPAIVGNHVEWNTTCAENGYYTISLLAADPYGFKDTCQFVVNAYNQPPQITDSLDTVIVRNQTRFKYYPTIFDLDDSYHVISYLAYPHWCAVVNDTVIGIAPDTLFEENLIVVVQDSCSVDTLAFLVVVYVCGDCNGDGVLDVADVVCEINYLFKGGPPPQPYAVGDVNCDGVNDIGDVVYLINYLFKGGPAPCLNCP